MAARNLLHKSKLEEFKRWLQTQGIAYRDGKGDYQVIQVEHPEHGYLVIYEKLDSKEHYSVPWKLTPIVIAFIEGKKLGNRPKPFEDWYVKLKGASTLTYVTVLSMTANTVVLKGISRFSEETRYAIVDIEFIEKVE